MNTSERYWRGRPDAEIQAALKTLRAKFAPDQISKKPIPTKKDNPKGMCDVCGGYHGLPAVHLDYVGHAATTNRILDADPYWCWEPVEMKNGIPVLDGIGGMWIRLTICGITRLGYGDIGGKEKVDPKNITGNAIKEIIGDAIRNAAMRFGVALELWHKGNLDIDNNNKMTDDQKFSASIDWINSFVERKVSVDEFDQKIEGNRDKLEKLPNQKRLLQEIQNVREYLEELQNKDKIDEEI